MTPEILAILLMSLIAFSAQHTGWNLLLFPELAALSYDVLCRPLGKWASQPLRLVLTPLLTATAGLLVTQHLQYGVVSILLIFVVCLAILRLLRSQIAPAISAGLLPLVLGEKSWFYPLAISIGLVGLVALLLVWKRYGEIGSGAAEVPEGNAIDEALESTSHDRFWLLHLLAFLTILGLAAQMTGARFLLFPPLVVMAFELLGHPEIPQWISRPALFPLACILTASTGLVLELALGIHPLAIAITMAVSVLLLRAFRIHLPPALAVGLLPFVIPAPDYRYPLSVAIGTGVLTLWYIARANRYRYPKV